MSEREYRPEADRTEMPEKTPSARRFPPPWTIDEANDACFIVKDHNGHALAYVYFENEPGHAHIWGSPWNVLQDLPEPENSPYPWSS